MGGYCGYKRGASGANAFDSPLGAKYHFCTRCYKFGLVEKSTDQYDHYTPKWTLEQFRARAKKDIPTGITKVYDSQYCPICRKPSELSETNECESFSCPLRADDSCRRRLGARQPHHRRLPVLEKLLGEIKEANKM